MARDRRRRVRRVRRGGQARADVLVWQLGVFIGSKCAESGWTQAPKIFTSTLPRAVETAQVHARKASGPRPRRLLLRLLLLLLLVRPSVLAAESNLGNAHLLTRLCSRQPPCMLADAHTRMVACSHASTCQAMRTSANTGIPLVRQLHEVLENCMCAAYVRGGGASA